MSLVSATLGTPQAPLYSSRGSQTVTAKPLNKAMVAKYSVSCPAPISSMRYSGPKVLTNCTSSMLSSVGVSLGSCETTPLANTVLRCINWPVSKDFTKPSSKAASGSNSNNNSKVPPQGRPKRCASSAVMPYFTR